MKLIVFGAGGRTGRQIVCQALEAGDEVTAVSRGADPFPSDPRLKFVRADILDRPSLSPLLAGQDAVLFAVGVRGNTPEGQKPTETYSRGTANVLAAMSEQGVRRLVCVTASGTRPGFDSEQPAMAAALRHIYDDMKRMEEAIVGSPTEWTIVRPHLIAPLEELPRVVEMLGRMGGAGSPSSLKPGSFTPGRYRHGEGYSLEDGMLITPADLADFMLRQARDSAYIRRGVAVAY